MAVKRYLDYVGLQEVVTKIKENYANIEALIYKGSVEDIPHLPDLATQRVGYMYTVQVGGGTTSDFVEGPGKILADGENVAAVEVITGYTAATPTGDENPKVEGWYEVVGSNYVLTTDTTVDPSKTYFIASKVLKWDMIGGLFNLEGRYLEFGPVMPNSPVNGRTFLYMGDTTYIYNEVTPVGDENPQEEGWYVEGSTPGTYELTTDITVQVGTTYYEQEEQYVKGVVYVYDNTLADPAWVPQTAGDTYDPITAREIDVLFE